MSLIDYFIAPFLLLLSSLLLIRHLHSSRPSSSSKSCAIIVLGDIGRSPRMLYHTRSFASHGYRTSVVAYRGNSPPQDLTLNPHIRFVYIPQPFTFISTLPRPLFLLFAPLKVISGALALLYSLTFLIDIAPAFLLVQNPPAIPTLPIVKLVGYLRASRVIIDWHNTGYSVLALRLGETSPVVKIAKRIETYWGRDAYAHLCVTAAMKKKLQLEAKIRGKAVVFHDRPPSSFKRLSDQEAHALYASLSIFSAPSLLAFASPSSPVDPLPALDTTLFTSKPLTSPTTTSITPVTYIPSRPALIVSATSWTPDEDFGILLDSIRHYEKEAESRRRTTGKGGLPKIIVVITGKGQMKEDFEKKVAELETGWNWVRVRTAWLRFEDYPRLLGAADLGISLHTSTSGADLPMKVVDMFGCGLPVLAKGFECVDELVKDGKNGYIFNTAEELTNKLIALLSPFPTFPSQIDLLRAGIKEADYSLPGEDDDDAADRAKGAGKWCSWEDNWDRVVEVLVKP